MSRSLRSSWPIFALIAAAIAVAAFLVVADQISRESPNYSKIDDGLWVGGYVAKPPRGTQAVLNLCETEDSYQVDSHHWEPIRDAEPAPSLAWLKHQVEFIESERAAGHTVFVHCLNGVSRSGMVAAAYLMRRENCSRDRALEMLRAQRPGIRPHPAFIKLLMEWQDLLGIQG